MKILIYNGDLTPPTFVESLAHKLADHGHDVYLLGRSEKVLMYKDESIFYVPCGSSTSVITTIASLVLIILKLLVFSPGRLFSNFDQNRKSKFVSFKNRLLHFILSCQINYIHPQVIHIQWASHISEFEPIILQSNYKTIVSLRGKLVNVTPLVDPTVKELYERLFPEIDAFHAVSDAIGKEAHKYGAPSNIIHVVYSGVDEKLLQTSFIEKDKSDVINVISVGRFQWKKGYNYALDACKILKEKDIKFTYTIVAKGSSEEIRFQIKDLELNDEVRIVGGLQHAEAINAIRNADLFLLPSVEEGIANVVLEAMAVGTLVISTDCGGMAELIEEEKNGFLVPVRNPAEIAKKIILFQKLTTYERKRITKAARETIIKKHSSRKQIGEMVILYQKVLNQDL